MILMVFEKNVFCKFSPIMSIDAYGLWGKANLDLMDIVSKI